jgi:hypothetical protein
VWVAAVTDCRG